MPRNPVMEVIRRHPKETLLSAGVRFPEHISFYLFSSFVPDAYLPYVTGMPYSVSIYVMICARSPCVTALSIESAVT
ncbi:MAG: hypothetical protein ACRDQ1_08385, partial [Sciscionella sp.]